MNDLISRQWLMECVNEGWVKFDTEKDENIFIHLVRDIAPHAHPKLNIVDDLLSFIERESNKENRTVADWVVQWILEEIISGKCKITGSATNHKEAKMYVEFSFYKEKKEE